MGAGLSVNIFFWHLFFKGSKKTVQGTAGYTILDCVYNAQTHTYIVLDLMCWRVRQNHSQRPTFLLFFFRVEGLETRAGVGVIVVGLGRVCVGCGREHTEIPIVGELIWLFGWWLAGPPGV